MRQSIHSCRDCRQDGECCCNNDLRRCWRHAVPANGRHASTAPRQTGRAASLGDRFTRRLTARRPRYRLQTIRGANRLHRQFRRSAGRCRRRRNRQSSAFPDVETSPCRIGETSPAFKLPDRGKEERRWFLWMMFGELTGPIDKPIVMTSPHRRALCRGAALAL